MSSRATHRCAISPKRPTRLLGRPVTVGVDQYVKNHCVIRVCESSLQRILEYVDELTAESGQTAWSATNR